MGCSANFLAFHYLCLYRIHLVLRMPPGNVGIAILPYCDLFVISRNRRGKQGRSSHTKQGEIKFTVSEYHTVTSDFNAHRGIKRDYLDSMVGTSQPLATLCSEETGLVGSKKKKKGFPIRNVLQSPLLCCQATPAAPVVLPALFPPSSPPPCTGAVLYKCVSLRWHVYLKGGDQAYTFKMILMDTALQPHPLSTCIICHSSHDNKPPSIGWVGQLCWLVVL